MNILGFVLIKNEEDIIESTIRHFLAEELDHIYAIDNLSSDNTPTILKKLKEEFPEKITILQDNEFAYYQSKKMNKYIQEYANIGDWIIPFDSDEIWFSRNKQSLKELLYFCAYDVIECPVYDMLPSLGSNINNPILDIKKRKTQSQLFPVVTFKYEKNCWLEIGNHQVIHSGNKTYGDIEVCHYQYRSFDQFCRKLKNGKEVLEATNLNNGIGFHWREGGSFSAEMLWNKWVEYCNQRPYTLDPCLTRITKWT